MSFDQDADGPVGETYSDIDSRGRFKRVALKVLSVLLLSSLICGAIVLGYFLLSGGASSGQKTRNAAAEDSRFPDDHPKFLVV